MYPLLLKLLLFGVVDIMEKDVEIVLGVATPSLVSLFGVGIGGEAVRCEEGGVREVGVTAVRTDGRLGSELEFGFALVVAENGCAVSSFSFFLAFSSILCLALRSSSEIGLKFESGLGSVAGGSRALLSWSLLPL